MIRSAQELLRENGIKWINSTKNKYTTECPTCLGGYLNVVIERDGAKWFCHSCGEGGGDGFEKKESELGPVKAIYDYTDEWGRLLFQALRFEPPGKPKQFRQRIGPNQEKWSVKGVRIVPYRLPELIEDIALERTIFVVEGEKDVDTLRQHCVPATCNPMGAGKWWASFNEIFKGADVVICGDNDQPGREHVSLVAKNLYGTVSRLRVLDLAQVWSEIEESDDISEWLSCHKVEELHQIVEALPDFQFMNGHTIEPSPPSPGLYRLHELPEPEPLVTWDTGMLEWSTKIRLAPRTLSVVTGQPGHGKTLFWAQVWQHVVSRQEVIACVASFETRPKPHLRRQLRSLVVGLLEYEMSEEQKQIADEWINERYLFLFHPQQRPTLEWLLDMAAKACDQHQAKILQIDPWNRLEAMRSKGETETEYVLRCLRELSNFANDKNCHVQIIAHPAKMDSLRRGKAAPELEDIAGSKAWDTIADQGFTVYREKMFDGMKRVTEMKLFHRKARFEELGYPCEVDAVYDLGTGKFYPNSPQSTREAPSNG